MSSAISLGLSLILVVGVIIGLIADKSRSGSNGSDGQPISTTSRTVASLCNATDYKHHCVRSAISVADNKTATAQDILRAAIGYTITEVQIAMKKSQGLRKDGLKSTDKMGLEDCKELLEYAIGELKESLSLVVDSRLPTLADREAELKDWLSAVISYQQTCLDGVEQSDVKKQLNNVLVNSTKLTSNALAIVSSISGIFNSLNITLKTNSSMTSRRLLEAEGSKREFPSWVSASDRRLLKTKTRARPNAVVAKDGSGQYNTITAALNAYPMKLTGRYVIYVKAGVYDEYITVTKKQTNVFIYGDGPDKTIVTGSKSFKGGFSTYRTASFAAVGFDFMAKNMGFRNTAGPEGHQAVALRVQSDRSSFYNCRMEGYQDTLYVHAHRQFYRNCVILGTVDFVFGDAIAVIQSSQLIARKPMANQQNMVTAHGRKDRHETTGLVIQNCRIIPHRTLLPTRLQTRSYLGRPWKPYSRTIIMESTIDDFIQPDGWMPWSGTLYLDTLEYREYANRGAGAATNRRVNWKGYKVIKDKNEAAQFTPGPFLQAKEWLPATGVPFYLDFTHSKDML